MDKKFMNVLGLIGVAAWILYFIWKSGSYTNKELTEAYITLASMTPLYFILTNLYSRFDKLVLWSLLCLGILSSGIAVYFHVHS
ncbi:hypothetical protein ACFFGV_04505 [Pontibacillus salicampi]|uniref:EamA domain-containing protein n=1 Tax=Pontibacillus salicampi TaxID=1449801 RepID=A0ABV6LKC5_9BACI